MIYCEPVQAQNISNSTITWEAQQVTDVESASTKLMSCQFVTKSGTTVDWVQKDGEMKTTFNIVETTGNWPDVSAAGTITYTLERKGKSCRMIIERSESGIFVTLDFSKLNEYTSHLRFKIESVN